MESLTTASDILAQLKELTKGMTLICRDMDALKLASLLQPNNNTAGPSTEIVDKTASELVPHTSTPSSSISATLTTFEPPARTSKTTWADEMDIVDPPVQDLSDLGRSPTIQVVPVIDRTNKFLNKAFSTQLAPVERKTLRSHYTLPQNELTKTPILDTMIASQCSSSVKSLDCTLSSLQGQMLEAVGPLSQLLEAVNDNEPQVSMDQIGEAVETAITLLANASGQVSAVRRARVLEDYNKELLPFAAAKERNWASAAPHLFGSNFLKEATDYLQQLQLLRKAKEKPVFQQTPLHSQQGGSKGKPWRQSLHSRSSGQSRKGYHPSGRRTATKK